MISLDRYFQKSESGEVLFYPLGMMGTGYKLQSRAEEDRLRSFLKTYFGVSFAALAVALATMGLKASLPVLALSPLWYYWSMRRMLKDVPTTKRRLSFADVAKSYGLSKLVLLEVFSVAFVAMSIVILCAGGPVLVPVAGIVFFGFGAVLFGLMIHKKLQG